MLRSIGILFATLLIASTGAAATGERTLLVYGDSLSAASGLRADQGGSPYSRRGSNPRLRIPRGERQRQREETTTAAKERSRARTGAAPA